jgi:hypothetical protein
MTMTKFASIAAAVAMAVTLVAAPAAKAGPYQQEHLVQALVGNRITETFQHDNPTTRVIRAAYLASFSLWYDSRCDFLPMPTFEAIKAIVAEARSETITQGTAEAAEIGLRDAKAFLGEQGCATRDANAARTALTGFWEGAMQAIANGGAGNGRAQPAPPPARTRPDFNRL